MVWNQLKSNAHSCDWVIIQRQKLGQDRVQETE